MDGSKALTALASDRDVLRTEVYDGKEWLELPLTNDSLAILPSRKLDRGLGVPPTWHRVLIDERRESDRPRPNVTLAFGVVDPP